jgi:hypothetical protein
MPEHFSIFRRIPPSLTTAALALISSIFFIAPVHAQDDQGRLSLFGHHFSVIGGVSYTVPATSETRGTFGDHAWAPVISIHNFQTPRGLGLSWDLAAWRMHQADRKALGLQGGVGPRFQFADDRSGFAPFVAVRGDIYTVRVDQGDWRARPGVNAEVGATIARHFVVSARYDHLPKMGGLDLSTFTASTAVKLF